MIALRGTGGTEYLEMDYGRKTNH